MPDLRFPTVFILAPPFYSHFRPLIALASALRDHGATVTVGCAEEFRSEVEALGLAFREVAINRNRNRGVAVETTQDDAETVRLHEFLEATRLGPVETLITQGRHRKADMFANPEELIESIRGIQSELSPSLWIVDQLSYGATLAVHGLDLPYVTFCAPHPLSIPTADMVYSVPPVWPSAVKPAPAEIDRLISIAREVDRDFTRAFNELLRTHFSKPPVGSAFALASPTGIICNYPPFPGLPGPGRIFAGHSFQEQALPEEWRPRLQGRAFRVLLALGTFLSSRDDVLTRFVELTLSVREDAQVFVGAGAASSALQSRFGDRVCSERFIPQRALLPHMDLAVFHGGVSSFTESLFTARPMIVMPFSSDQFNVARDVERLGLGSVLDPNNLTREEIAAALAASEDQKVRDSIARWSGIVGERGPGFAAGRILHPGGLE